MRAYYVPACLFLTLIPGAALTEPAAPHAIMRRAGINAHWTAGVDEATTGDEIDHAANPSANRHRKASQPGDSASQPHVIDAGIGDVMVRIMGSLCTGTPVTGTVYVVTAAHCVLTPGGHVIERTVVRDGVSYRPIAALVDTGYAGQPREEGDAAVLVMAQVIPGPSATVGSAMPDSGEVTLAGYQPVDSNGALMRARLHDGPLLTGVSDTEAERYRPAACVDSVQHLDITSARVMVRCGLVPGASGGGLFTEQDGHPVLVGIVSTVTGDLSANGVVPLASLQKLLRQPEQHIHPFSATPVRRGHPTVCGVQCLGSVPRAGAHVPSMPSKYVGVSMPVQTPCSFSGLFVSSQTPHNGVLSPIEVGRQRP
jgi:hypothetical protein